MDKPKLLAFKIWGFWIVSPLEKEPILNDWSTHFWFALGNERPRVKYIYFVFSFPNANKKVNFYPYFYAKATNNP